MAARNPFAHWQWYLIAIVAIFLFGLFAHTPPDAIAARVDELRNQIEDRNKEIEALEREIAEFQKQLNVISGEKRTLQSAVDELDISRQKLAVDIRATGQRIQNADLEIEKIGLEVNDKGRRILQNNEALGETIRRMNEAEATTLIEAILLHDNLSELWNELATLEQFQTFVRSDLDALVALKGELETEQEALRIKRQELAQLRTTLAGQKQSLDNNRQEKNRLLTQTANKEAQYQQLITEKEAAREAFEQELFELSQELKFELDPSTIPPAGQGILTWPFSKSYMANCPNYAGALGNIYCLTQSFGNTAFSIANSAVYSGRGHNGVDFRASSGTKVTAALRGEVIGAGNTDLQRGCYSFGKWVMIRHNNGLSTLYAHLSVISVATGQQVETGDVIGFSGNTGYSTGPHLHFGVYATSGTRIVRLGDVKARTNCSNVSVPVADIKAYLNPLSYL